MARQDALRDHAAAFHAHRVPGRHRSRRGGIRREAPAGCRGLSLAPREQLHTIARRMLALVRRWRRVNARQLPQTRRAMPPTHGPCRPAHSGHQCDLAIACERLHPRRTTHSYLPSHNEFCRCSDNRIKNRRREIKRLDASYRVARRTSSRTNAANRRTPSSMNGAST